MFLFISAIVKLTNVYIPFTLTNSSSIFISWELPYLPFNPVPKPTINNFIVFYRVIGNVVIKTKSVGSNQFNTTIGDLIANTEYEIIVGVKYKEPNFSGRNVTFSSIRTRPQSKCS